MRNSLFLLLACVLFLTIKQAAASEIFGTAANLLMLKNIKNSTEIYANNFQNKYVLIYKADFNYKGGNGVAADLYGNILSLVFNCSPEEICVRFFNRKTNAISKVYYNFVAANTDKDKQVVAYYNKSNSTLFIEPMFTACKQPLTYHIKLYPDSDFGQESNFLHNGNLKLDYLSAQSGDNVTDIIRINYAKLFADCKNN